MKKPLLFLSAAACLVAGCASRSYHVGSRLIPGSYTIAEMTRTLTMEEGVRRLRVNNMTLACHNDALGNPFADRYNLHLEDGVGDMQDADTNPDPHYLGGLYAKTAPIFPAGDLRVGDSWTGTDTLDADPRVSLSTRFTLLKAQNGVLYVQSDAEIDLIETPLPGSRHPGLLTLKGRQRGIWEVDARTGIVLDAHSNLRAAGTLHMGEKSIALHIDSTCSVIRS